MANREAELRLQELEENQSKKVVIDGKKYSFKLPTNYVQEKISKLITKAEISFSEDKKEMLVAMTKNRTLAPKCYSLYSLHNPIKVWFVHWFRWRFVHLFKTQEWINNRMEFILSQNDFKFFFANLASLQGSNTLEEMTAQMDTKTMYQKQGLQGETKQ